MGLVWISAWAAWQGTQHPAGRADEGVLASGQILLSSGVVNVVPQPPHPCFFMSKTLCKTAYLLVVHNKAGQLGITVGLSFLFFSLAHKTVVQSRCHGPLAAFWPAMCINGLVCKVAGCCRMLPTGPTFPPSSKGWLALLQRPSSALQMMHCVPSI